MSAVRSAAPEGRPAPLRLWSGDAPLAKGSAAEDIPALTPYLSPEARARGAFIVCPGGGYSHFGEHEGHGYALWLASRGYHAFVLRYRLGSQGYRHPAMWTDAARALRWVRSQAGRWNIPRDRIGIVGSSAGGHLAAHLLTQWDAGDPAAADPVERESCRPDLGVLCYPVVTLLDPLANTGSRRNLLGDPPPEALCRALSVERNVTADTPPCFLWHCVDDTAVAVENSLLFAQALRRVKVPFELHLYERGGHGGGLRVQPTWAAALLDWLAARWPDLPAQAAGPATAAPPALQPAPATIANRCRLVLPDLLEGLVGEELNLYFDNVVLAAPGRPFQFAVRADRGRQQQDRWTWTPAEPGTCELECRVFDADDRVVGGRTLRVRVLAASDLPQHPIRLLAIGDSLTHASVYTGELLSRFAAPGLPPFALVGTHRLEDQPEGNRHEGHGGWRFQDFVEKWEASPDSASPRRQRSPFLFEGPDGPQLDVARYVHEELGGVPPTHVTLFLGPNDIFRATAETLDAEVETVLRHAAALLAALRRALPDAVIGLLPPLPPATSQDAFGASYGCAQTRRQYRLNQHRLVEALVRLYGNRAEEKLHILPSWACFDAEHGYPVTEGPAHRRSTRVVFRASNAVHPCREGYQQLADLLFAWLLHHA